MYRILAGLSVAAVLGLGALSIPASAATPTHDQSIANANATTDMSAHRRYYRRYYRHYGYRSYYYGAPYYAYAPGPYYYGYGPRYYRPGISFGIGVGPGWW